jgi:hypothetical protein
MLPIKEEIDLGEFLRNQSPLMIGSMGPHKEKVRISVRNSLLFLFVGVGALCHKRVLRLTDFLRKSTVLTVQELLWQGLPQEYSFYKALVRISVRNPRVPSDRN